MKHEKTEMKRIALWNQVHEGHTGRHWRVWHWTYECPVCHGYKYPLVNPNRFKKFYCSGDSKIKEWHIPKDAPYLI